MNVPLVMTVIGPDRPGLVGLLASVIADHGGNWLESRMAHLGGQFAGILRIHIPESRQAALLDAFRAVETRGLSVRALPDSPDAGPAEFSVAVLEVVGHDRPGIIREISQVLARLNVNVEELVTTVESAPMSAETLFRAEATVRLPDSASIQDVRGELEKIATDLMVDIGVASLKP